MHMTHKSKRIPHFSPKKNCKKIKENEVLQFCVETRILHVKWFLLWLNYNFSLTWMFPLVFKVKQFLKEACQAKTQIKMNQPYLKVYVARSHFDLLHIFLMRWYAPLSPLHYKHLLISRLEKSRVWTSAFVSLPSILTYVLISNCQRGDKNVCVQKRFENHKQ